MKHFWCELTKSKFFISKNSILLKKYFFVIFFPIKSVYLNSLFFLSHFAKVDGMPVIELFDYLRVVLSLETFFVVLFNLSVVVLQPSGSHDRVHRGRCKTHPRRTQSHQILINNGTGENENIRVYCKLYPTIPRPDRKHGHSFIQSIVRGIALSHH